MCMSVNFLLQISSNQRRLFDRVLVIFFFDNVQFQTSKSKKLSLLQNMQDPKSGTRILGPEVWDQKSRIRNLGPLRDRPSCWRRVGDGFIFNSRVVKLNMEVQYHALLNFYLSISHRSCLFICSYSSNCQKIGDKGVGTDSETEQAAESAAPALTPDKGSRITEHQLLRPRIEVIQVNHCTIEELSLSL